MAAIADLHVYSISTREQKSIPAHANATKNALKHLRDSLSHSQLLIQKDK